MVGVLLLQEQVMWQGGLLHHGRVHTCKRLSLLLGCTGPYIQLVGLYRQQRSVDSSSELNSLAAAQQHQQAGCKPISY
jgi:hypothetical protein